MRQSVPVDGMRSMARADRTEVTLAALAKGEGASNASTRPWTTWGPACSNMAASAACSEARKQHVPACHTTAHQQQPAATACASLCSLSDSP